MKIEKLLATTIRSPLSLYFGLH